MQFELKQRVVSAVALGLATLALTWWGGWPFKLFAVVLMMLIHFEWTTMIGAYRQAPSAAVTAWIAVVIVAGLTLAGWGALACLAIALGAVISAFLAIVSARSWWIGLGVVYAGFSGLALAEIRDDALIGLAAMAFLFAVVWSTDIFAYFCGRAIGGPKLAVRISPGKTWSGAVFGTIAGIAAGTAMAFAVIAPGGLWIPVLAAILSIASQVGDLMESWMKRRFAVKDSGRLIPGHGGVMDRVDGLVFAAFAAFLISVAITGHFPGGEGGAPVAAALLGL